MSKTLYVGNLPWAITDDQLEEVFSPYVEVISSRIVTDRDTGRSRGFGFVEVETDDIEPIIKSLHGTTIDGREITVNEAKAREPRM
ncbi:MAG: RNA-binding protein [Firmicutes bacterium]|jgi:RNA recognition motif-containing protein|nr:RNA-binding protein [Bacillota bacterium]MDD4338031.1 RNA-binding protein [Bacillota bacterium]